MKEKLEDMGMDKEKIVQIYETVSDKTLARIKNVGIDDYTLKLVRTTQSLYGNHKLCEPASNCNWVSA